MCHFAYEDEDFDRAVGLLIKITETIKEKDFFRKIVQKIQPLFSIYLSGTMASPARRQAFVKKLLVSQSEAHHEIAKELMEASLEESHFSSFAALSFGARNRGAGWKPQTYKEKSNWYTGFITLLEPVLASNDVEKAKWAKGVFAEKFRSFWSSAHCFDALEKNVLEHAKGGAWTDLWLAIKQTIHYDGDSYPPNLLQRLKELEKESAPVDLYSKIEAYAFTDTWKHDRLDGGDYEIASQLLNEKIINLGQLICSDTHYLEQLGDRLWEKHINALFPFGMGLARGCFDKEATFEMLVGLLKKTQVQEVNSTFLRGFLKEIHNQQPNLSRQMLERILEEKKLKKYFVELVSAMPIDAWGAKKLIELANGGELEAWRFIYIHGGRIHETINNENLIELLEALFDLDGGICSVFSILNMRFFIDGNTVYLPSEELLALGRKAITLMLEMSSDDINGLNSYEIGRVAKYCLGSDAPKNEVADIISLYCKRVESLGFYRSKLKDFISILIVNFPELFLDRIFSGNKNEEQVANMLSRYRMQVSYALSSFSKVPIDKLVGWCGGEQDKIQMLAKMVSIIVPVETGKNPLDEPKPFMLSDHIKALLNIAEDKKYILNIIFDGVQPTSWGGGLANVLEIRSSALLELLEHTSPAVKQLAAEKMQQLKEKIKRYSAEEAKRDAMQEQRFE